MSFADSVVVVRFPRRRMTLADLEVFIAYIEALWKAGQHFVWIIDVTNSPLQDPGLQYKAAVWAKHNKSMFQNYCWGTAYVVNDGITRRIVQFLLNTMGASNILGPVEFFDDLSHALQWTRKVVDSRKNQILI